MTTSLTVHQVRRPQGMPTAADFALVEETLPRLAEGQALVENAYLSVDPYMREAMADNELHAALEGRAVGRVVASRTPSLAVGDVVFHRHGLRSHALVRYDEVRVLAVPDRVPLSAYLGIMGGTGLSAYVGLKRTADLRAGETLFVSAAAGGVGTAAGRLARLLGARRVIGSTGSAVKARHLTEHLGFDAAFDYHDGVLAGLRAAAPDGIDVYLDNVGGEHLEAAIEVLRERGRIAWCGAIAQYNDPQNPPPAPRNLYAVVGKQLRLEGFLVRQNLDLRDELEALVVPEIQAGRLVSDETIFAGVERTVEAFLAVLRGENVGKMLVRA
ncbi:MAG: NADP-dependent oxidoreductase [Hamadaea sp.]|uniref:NADP-dependent oxidoreductase n=1 Tax=Hamadaea sp. TaxID=2024425 RepID=UPI0017D0CFAD|nr:NADP-dependent oxidoreductase [Hamadaea sp.]NUR73689.1 NADP-dependent oxidoreductase [Hamadaea sp.]NUT22540.1 NADP-dependent oxidoreductase [Hamadaea sp.]